MRYRHWVLLVLGVVLTLGLFAAVVGSARVQHPKFHGRLSELLPKESDLNGWQVRVRRFAESIEMERFTRELLLFDDAVYVDFLRGDMRVSIYLAYWRPGTVSSHWVASHTPDTCWVYGGWQCLLRDTKSIGREMSASFVMEHRTFRLNEQVEHVVFCHLVDGRPQTYVGVGPLPSRLRDFLDRLNSRQWRRPDTEQFFIRISSNRPLADFAQTSPVQILLQRIADVNSQVHPR